MRVVAIDPATAGKGSTMYSAETGFDQISAKDMRCRIARIALEKPPVLLCWDSPLTGPRDPEDAGHPRDFTVRRLDSFFRQEKFWRTRDRDGFQAPPGISVQPYAQCSHWTISRSVLGMPRLGPFDAAYHCLPFHLLPDRKGEFPGPEVERVERPCVVEIHPGVAAWLWCKDLKEFESEDGNGDGWEYKKNDGLRAKMWRAIRRECGIGESLPEEPCNDDQFDAVIGYILGVKWVRGDRRDSGEEEVVLLGDRKNGSMLLPRMAGLCEAWEEFRDDGSA